MAGEVSTNPYELPGNYTIQQSVGWSGGVQRSSTKNVTVVGQSASTPTIRSVVSTTNAAPGDTSITFPAVSNFTSGDFVIAVISQRASNPTVTIGSAWTLKAKIFDVAQSLSHHIFTRLAGVNSPSPTATSTSAGAMAGTLYVIQTGSFSSSFNFMVDPIGSWSSVSSNTFTISSITTPSANGLQIAQVVRLNNDVIPAITSSGGWTVDAKWDSTTAAAFGSPVSQNMIGVSEHRTLTASGPSTSATVNTPGGNANIWSGVQMVVSPASVTASSPNLAGDPGNGKIYVSWNNSTDGDYTTNWTAEQTRLRNISYVKGGTTKAANASRSGGVYVDYRAGIEGAGSATYAFGGAGTQSRSVVQSGRIYAKFLDWTPAECLLYINNDPTYTAFVSSLITNFNACKTAGYTGSFWIGLHSGPSSTFSSTTAQERANFRAAHRKLYSAIKITGGCTNVSFMSPMYSATDFSNAVTNFNGGAPTGSGVYKNWWEWHPDWNGQFNGWTDGANPNRSDFKIGFSSDPAITQTVDIFACGVTCNHAISSATAKDPSNGVWTWTSSPNATTWTDTIYEQHTPFNAARNSGFTSTGRHLLDMRSILDVLYGTRIAPIFLPEFSFATFERSGTDPSLPESLAHWDYMLSDMIGANVKGVVYWRATIATTPAVSSSIWSLGGKFAVGNVVADTSEARRKVLANLLDNILVVGV